MTPIEFMFTMMESGRRMKCHTNGSQIIEILMFLKDFSIKFKEFMKKL